MSVNGYCTRLTDFHVLWMSIQTTKKYSTCKFICSICFWVCKPQVCNVDLCSGIARAFPGGRVSRYPDGQNEEKMSKVWGNILRKIDRDLTLEKWGKWNSCLPGTVRLATALDLCIIIIDYKKIKCINLNCKNTWQKSLPELRFYTGNFWYILVYTEWHHYMRQLRKIM